MTDCNNSPEQNDYLRGVETRTIERKQGKRTDLTSSHNATKSDIDDLAKEHEVNRATLYRDATYADAVDTIAKNVGKKAKDAILSGETKTTKKDIIRLAGAAQKEWSRAGPFFDAC